LIVGNDREGSFFPLFFFLSPLFLLLFLPPPFFSLLRFRLASKMLKRVGTCRAVLYFFFFPLPPPLFLFLDFFSFAMRAVRPQHRNATSPFTSPPPFSLSFEPLSLSLFAFFLEEQKRKPARFFLLLPFSFLYLSSLPLFFLDGTGRKILDFRAGGFSIPFFFSPLSWCLVIAVSFSNFSSPFDGRRRG